MIKITPMLFLNESDIRFAFIASPGPGGQNVNKVATGVQLRFNVLRASLPEDVRARLLLLLGRKLTTQGEWIIKATRFRTQERNKQDALERLIDLLRRAAIPPKKRRKTRPTNASVERRLTKKKLQSVKKLRRGRNEEGI